MNTGWATKPLGQVCIIKPPKSEARARLAAGELVSFLPMEDLGIDRKFVYGSQAKPLSAVAGSYTYFADGDVLLAKITPCFENGKLGIADGLSNGIGFGSSEYIVFRPTAALNKEWLYYFLSRESFREEGAARMAGAVGHKRVAKEFIESYPIPIPPLAEQKRIVAILDEAFAGIAKANANAKKNLQNARAIFESQLQAGFAHRGVGWSEKTLETLVDETCSLSYGIVQPGEEFPNGMAIVRPTDLATKVIEIEGLKRIDPLLAKSYGRTSLTGGELLLCVRGSTGVVSIASNELAGANVTRGIAPIRFQGSQVIQEFGYYLLIGDPVQSQIRGKTYGAALMQINIGDLRKLKISVPPLREQRRLVVALNALSAETDRLANLYERKLVALEDFKRSLLHSAFSGDLTSKKGAARVEAVA